MSVTTTADLQAAAKRFSLFAAVLLLTLLSIALGLTISDEWFWPLLLLLPLLALGIGDLVQPAIR